jgi:hypothetical protein
MAEQGRDTFMRMITDDGVLYAECQTEISTDMDPFTVDYFNGEFFEVEDFRFSLKVLDSGSKSSDKPAASQGPTAGGHAATAAAGAGTGAGARPGRLDPSRMAMFDGRATKAAKQGDVPGVAYGKWKSATPDELKKVLPYPVDMNEVTIDRTYDKASPILYQMCCDSETFPSVSLIKRKDIGDTFLRGFLRLDFEDVMVTSVEWKNGEVMKETFTFVFRRVTVKYRQSVFVPGQQVAQMKQQPDVMWNYALDLALAEKAAGG